MSKKQRHLEKDESDLPICESSFAADGIEEADAAPQGVASASTNELPKVFIVEDDPLVLDLLSVKLKHSKCPFMYCSEGGDAVESIRKFDPDVIVLDIMLPGKDGFAVLEELRQDESLKQIPVLIYSNNNSDEDKARARKLAVERFCVKATTHLPSFITEVLEVARSAKAAKAY